MVKIIDDKGNTIDVNTITGIKSGDIITYQLRETVSQDQIIQIHGKLKDLFPMNELIIVPCGAELSILRNAKKK